MCVPSTPRSAVVGPPPTHIFPPCTPPVPPGLGERLPGEWEILAGACPRSPRLPLTPNPPCSLPPGPGGRLPPMPDECKIFVGNLPPAYDSNMLRALFDPVADAAGSK